MPIGRVPLKRHELLQYLGVIADFKIVIQNKTPKYETLEVVVTSATAWNWDSNVQREMLLLPNATRLPFPPTRDELLKTGTTAAYRPQYHHQTLGNDSSSPTTMTLRHGGRNPEVGEPPTAMWRIPKPTAATALSDTTGTRQRQCGAQASTATSIIGGQLTAIAVALANPSPASTQRSANHEHACLTVTHRNPKTVQNKAMKRNLTTLITNQIITTPMAPDTTLTCIRNAGKMISSLCVVKLL